MEANPQLLLAVILVFDTQHVTVLADLMALHALVCFQVLSMVEGVRPAGVREEERPPKLPCSLLSPGNEMSKGEQIGVCSKFFLALILFIR